MSKYRVEHTVEFIVNESHLYGVIEKISMDEEGDTFYTIAVRTRLYRNIPEKSIIHDFGVIE